MRRGERGKEGMCTLSFTFSLANQCRIYNKLRPSEGGEWEYVDLVNGNKKKHVHGILRGDACGAHFTHLSRRTICQLPVVSRSSPSVMQNQYGAEGGLCGNGTRPDRKGRRRGRAISAQKQFLRPPPSWREVFRHFKVFFFKVKSQIWLSIFVVNAI